MPLNDDPSGAFSRRDFFKTVVAGSLATGVAGATQAEAQTAGPPQFGPAEVPIRLTVNGRTYNLLVEPRVTLLDALRNRADLTGSKRVCDRGTCGACTMILDGLTIYACSTLAIDVQGSKIRTVEGLATGDKLHPVQAAFCDVDALMCGFCTPGFVMATVALLERYPNATPAQARRELDGNVCRCGTQKRIVEAALKARPGRPRAAAGAIEERIADAPESGVTRG